MVDVGIRSTVSLSSTWPIPLSALGSENRFYQQ